MNLPRDSPISKVIYPGWILHDDFLKLNIDSTSLFTNEETFHVRGWVSVYVPLPEELNASIKLELTCEGICPPSSKKEFIRISCMNEYSHRLIKKG